MEICPASLEIYIKRTAGTSVLLSQAEEGDTSWTSVHSHLFICPKDLLLIVAIVVTTLY